MATFVMQALGCEVTAINTVQFSMWPATWRNQAGEARRKEIKKK